jgi:1,4-alpha-glucan branching enzyme
MHDTLRFFARDPVHRGFHLGDLTFAELYEQSERFLMPLSHDEVVHGKGSLLARMPGDAWQKLANLRLLLAYQWTRPGKKLVFMGTELAPATEWRFDASLDWHLGEDPARAGLGRFLEALGRLYREHPCLWRADPDREGFAWIDCSDAANAVLCYRRRADADELVVVLNTTPVTRPAYRIGAPRPGAWREVLCSDAEEFGGSGLARPQRFEAQPVACHGHAHSIELVLPGLAGLVLAPA